MCKEHQNSVSKTAEYTLLLPVTNIQHRGSKEHKNQPVRITQSSATATMFRTSLSSGHKQPLLLRGPATRWCPAQLPRQRRSLTLARPPQPEHLPVGSCSPAPAGRWEGCPVPQPFSRYPAGKQAGNPNKGDQAWGKNLAQGQRKRWAARFVCKWGKIHP